MYRLQLNPLPTLDRLEKATEKNNKENIEKYQTFLRHLGTHPAKRDAEGAKFKKKLLTSIFNTGTKKGKLDSTFESKGNYYYSILFG